MEQLAVSISSHLSDRGFVSMPAWACHLLLCRLLFISIFPLLAHLSATLTFFQPHLSKLPYSLSRFFPLSSPRYCSPHLSLITSNQFSARRILPSWLRRISARESALVPKPFIFSFKKKKIRDLHHDVIELINE